MQRVTEIMTKNARTKWAKVKENVMKIGEDFWEKNNPAYKHKTK